MNQHAKSPEEVFDLQDFFETEEKDIYIGVAKTFFNIYSSVDKLCELGKFNYVYFPFYIFRCSEIHCFAYFGVLSSK
jgi:hypothetical protein